MKFEQRPTIEMFAKLLVIHFYMRIFSENSRKGDIIKWELLSNLENSSKNEITNSGQLQLSVFSALSSVFERIVDTFLVWLTDNNYHIHG